MTTHKELLGSYYPCADAIEWYETQGSSREAWDSCHRGDWLLWIAARLDVDHKTIVLAACDCAETSLEFVPAGERRPQRAIETARLWAKGKATISEVTAAADASFAYAADAFAAADASAYASASAYAADASFAASAASYAADASFAAASDVVPCTCVRLVRTRIPWQMIQAAIDSANQ